MLLVKSKFLKLRRAASSENKRKIKYIVILLLFQRLGHLKTFLFQSALKHS